MLWKTGTIDPILFFATLAGFVALLAYLMAIKYRAIRQKRNRALVAFTIADYFRKSGVVVSVTCSAQSEAGQYTALIESEPMKRFRLSHIIEMTLIDYVRKTCGLELTRVYWRFPIKEAEQTPEPGKDAEADAKPAPGSDEYINEGLVHYKYLPKVEVTETSWETFAEVSTVDPAKPAPDKPAAEPDRK